MMTRLSAIVGRDLAQTMRYVFVRQAVESVPADAFCVETLRNSEMIGHSTMATMECRVEAGNLWHFRTPREKRTDRSKVIRLVERRQRNVAFKARHHFSIDQYGAAVLGASMHDAMPDRF